MTKIYRKRKIIFGFVSVVILLFSPIVHVGAEDDNSLFECTINGPSEGSVGGSYTFTVSSIPWSSDVDYFFGWQVCDKVDPDIGDDCLLNGSRGVMQTDGWVESKSVKLSWDQPGNYSVCTQARNQMTYNVINLSSGQIETHFYYQYTVWAETYIVITNAAQTDSDRDSEIINDKPRILAKTENNDVKIQIISDEKPVDWNINLNGMIPLDEKKYSGIVQRNDYQDVDVSFFGLGPIEITISANNLTHHYEAFSFGLYQYNLRKVN